MKRLVVFLCASALVFCLDCPVMAGGIDNKHNFSAEYIRTLNRNGATDSADGVVYNPAGVVKMEEGFYLNLSGQYAFKDYSNTIGGTEYESDEPDIVPGFFALFRKDKFAGFAALTIPCGGGAVDYTDGNATSIGLAQRVVAGANDAANESIRSSPLGALPPSLLAPAIDPYSTFESELEGESYYTGFTLGGAYEVNDMLSVSLGARYIDVQRELKGSATIFGSSTTLTTPMGPQTVTAPEIQHSVKYEETDTGWGGILGVNIAPTDRLNIGIRYETKTSLDLESDEKTDTLNGSPPPFENGVVVDGAERSRDLPALLGIGVSHQCTPNLRTEVNLTYYFNEDADWDDNPVSFTQDETKRDDGFDLGLALEYKFMPELKASVGYMYTDVGIDPDDMSFEAPELDAHSIAGGVVYEAMPGLNLNLGILKTFYQDEKTSSGIKLEKDVIIIAAGVQYKFW